MLRLKGHWASDLGAAATVGGRGASQHGGVLQTARGGKGEERPEEEQESLERATRVLIASLLLGPRCKARTARL